MSEAGMWGTEVSRGDGPVPFLVYERRRRRVTELLDAAARWTGRDHLVQGQRRVTFKAMAAAADREESPSPAVDARLRAELTAAAVAVGQAIGYVGAARSSSCSTGTGRFTSWRSTPGSRSSTRSPRR
jgi:hypothetical protein